MHAIEEKGKFHTTRDALWVKKGEKSSLTHMPKTV